VVNLIYRPLYSRERIPVPTKQEAEWPPELVWMVLKKRKSLAPPVFKTRIVKPVVTPASLQSEDNNQCAFSIKGTTRHNYPPTRQTVYQYSYTDDMSCLTS
jgi:hypothetical protein